MHRLAPRHSRDDARHLALHHGMLDNLVDPADDSRVQPITVAHTTTLGPELDSASRE
jgi:hypothetical protein